MNSKILLFIVWGVLTCPRVSERRQFPILQHRQSSTSSPDTTVDIVQVTAERAGLRLLPTLYLSQQSSSWDNDKTSSEEGILRLKDTMKREMKVVMAEEENKTIELIPQIRSSSCKRY
jgi:hypothetical protein